MFCNQCGQPLRDGAKFCPACGEPVVEVPGSMSGDDVSRVHTTPAVDSAPEETTSEQPQAAPEPELPEASTSPAQEAPRVPRRRTHPAIVIAIVVLAIALAGTAGFLIWKYVSASGSSPFGGRLSTSDEEAGADSGAVGAERDDTVDEPSPEIDVDVDAVLHDAQEAAALGDYGRASDLLAQLDGENDLPALYDELTEAVALSPVLVAILPGDGRNMSVTFTFATAAPDKAQLTLTDNGEVCEFDYSAAGTSGLITWQTPEGAQPGEREVVLSVRIGGVTLPMRASYAIVAAAQEASMRFVSADVSAFPLVQTFIRVLDTATGEPVSGLPAEAFTLRESVEGGAFISREVQSAHQLDGTESLSVTLIADKSDSISDGDMERIKEVMQQFVDSLQFAVGDQAEVLSFDTIVRQMCSYTGEAELLKNGISNMFPEGSTALYDALNDGITSAARQIGAGCVIAFTDGIDNMSTSTSEDVIEYAVKCGIPVYIIGVGPDVYETTLRDIASRTGGQYWFIDDLLDLSAIYAAVYEQEKGMYVITYEADEVSGRYAARAFEVNLADTDWVGSCTGSFAPNEITDPEPYAHTSRYELFLADVSWEEAKARCEALGGHLATITSQEEMDTLIALAEEAGVTCVWLGGYTSYDAQGSVFGHWITGEPFTYENWSDGEPSRVDHDGTEEYYIMLWNVESLGGWTWNDQRNDPAGSGFLNGRIAYVCEWE